MGSISLVLATWLASAAIARAEPPAPARVAVAAQGCEGLDDAEVGRLLDLELGTVTTELRSGPPLQVELRCIDERMEITVVDPITRKRLARDIPAPPPEPGRERVVALAISQLFAASWLELLTQWGQQTEATEEQSPPPQTEAIEAARRVAERATSTEAEPDPSPARRELELLVGAGPRGRALQDEGRLPAARAELLLRGWLTPSVGLVAVVGWDYGQTTRRLGQVRGQAVTAGGGLAWGWRPGRIGVGGHVVLAGGWARVRGLPRETGIYAAANQGVTAEASAGVGPRVRYGRLRFDLDAELGAMLRPPVGIVDDGPPMTMGGLWAGVVLRLGGSLR